MIKHLRPKYLAKYLWFGFGLAGLVIVAKTYFPNLIPAITDSDLVKGVQSELIYTQTGDYSSNPSQKLSLTDLEPEQASQVLGKVIKEQITKVLKETTEEVKEFPKKQVRKIKIGACEELLEEDICSVASELNCSVSDSQ